MQFTWHLLVIIAAVLIGVCLFQKGEKNPNMSADQMKQADMYRIYAYILWAIAIAVAIYCYYFQNKSKKARMCGGGHYRGYMCSARAYH